MSDNYYQILGVSKSASDDEIAKAYRKLARQYHPDLNPNDPKSKEKFQKLQEAFDVLSNPEKRRIFDQFGVSPDKMGQGPTGNGGFQWNGGGGRSPFGGMNLDEILRQMMGGGAGADSVTRGSARQQTRGDDVESTIVIPFQIAIEGGTRELKVRQSDGKLHKIDLKIPAGIEHGKKIRLRGQGKQGTNGGKAGDLLVTINVAPDQSFRRDGDNLYVTVPVTLKEAVLGAKIDIPSPKGTVSVKVPAGSTSGTKLRIKGFGVLQKNNERGDLYAELSVTLPQKWSEEDKTAITNLKTEQSDSVRSELKW
ncbi:MAG: J domain-containing protein [Planctomycetaceae bacterium]|jgi:DnaJ-class molecular chaperone|nr:J domain-containing protein [Planctomycetaceae bacterium]